MKAAEFADAQRFLLAHAARLRAYLHMMLGNLHDAEDVLQETFASFLEKGPAPSEHASRWLFTVSRNHALTLRRTQLRRIDREQAAATLAASSSDAAGADPAAIANDRDAIDHLGKCLARLDEELREIVYLRFAEELSLSEIAERLHAPKSTVALRCQQGLVELNRHFHGGAA